MYLHITLQSSFHIQNYSAAFKQPICPLFTNFAARHIAPLLQFFRFVPDNTATKGTTMLLKRKRKLTVQLLAAAKKNLQSYKKTVS